MKIHAKKIKHWDMVTKVILAVSLIVIILAFIAPFFFTTRASMDLFDFKNTAPIGDTIGGIVNPFIALAGVLLTFLAFYMQIKANKIQVEQFYDGLENEKKLRTSIKRQKAYNKLSLLHTDLKAIESDLQIKCENLKEYYKLEKSQPYQQSYLKKDSCKNYARVLEIDRLGIYKGFELFFKNDKWIKDFSNLYDILDLLPELFKDIYERYDLHNANLYRNKVVLKKDISKLIQSITEILKFNHKNQGVDQSIVNFLQSSLSKYERIINNSYDIDGSVVGETDFARLDEEFLKDIEYFINHLTENNLPISLDRHYIIDLVDSIRKHSFQIKRQSQDFARSIELNYNQIIGYNQQRGYLETLTVIRKVIEQQLESVEL